jgi:hypothetical protein
MLGHSILFRKLLLDEMIKHIRINSIGFLLLIFCFPTLIIPIPSLAQSKDDGFVSTVTLSEEFNDNVNETANAKSDLVTSLKPTLKWNYIGNRTTGSISYAGNLRQYAFDNRQDEFLNTLEAKAQLDAVKNLLSINFSDNNKMVFTDATLGATNDADSTTRQVNQNSFTTGATLLPASWERTPVTLDASFFKTTYWDGTGIDKTGQQITLDLLHSTTDRLDLGGDAKFFHQEATGANLIRLSASGVIRYTYADNCFIYGRIGLIRSQAQGFDREIKPIWSAGLSHNLGRTVINIDSQAGYIDNPSSNQDTYRHTITAYLQRTIDRSMLTVNAGYTDYTTQNNEQNKQITLGFKEAHELTSRLRFTISGSYVTNTTLGQTLDRLYGSTELNYDLPNDYTISLWYRHKASNSTASSTNTYQVHITGVGLQKTF